ncbi:MAG: low molecular weight protein arginine phosphatase [Firmicutes bacterium HGW-Firmicutes-13]|nr:MAG: low molecular weight protein arginine phosphatase [Firmicutes bacterium HGW-Firmicutes-13]
MKKIIIFVCTGNTCRSIMAEALAKKILSGYGRKAKNLEIISAGLAAFPGEGASRQARAVLEKEGINVDGHTARLLNPDMVNDAHLILTMTQSHKRAILDIVPEAEPKVFSLKEFLGEGKSEGSPDVDDPFGLSEEAYKKILDKFKEMFPPLLGKILNED